MKHNETPYVYKRRVSTVIQLIEPKKGGLYLDVGCGDGRFEKLLEDFDVIGTEISYEAIKDQKNVLLCDGMDLPFSNNYFDGIVDEFYYFKF